MALDDANGGKTVSCPSHTFLKKRGIDHSMKGVVAPS